MKAVAILLCLLLATSSVFAAVVDQRAACNQDNCYRAVIKPSSLSARSADCSSFLTPTTITVTIATITTTTYSIYGQDATVTNVPKRRDVSTATIPTYASWCSGSVRYSSACSCLGITQVTAMTTTTPATAVTVTSTVTACNPANNYGLNYNGVSYEFPPGTQEDSSYGPDNYFTSTPAECCAACFTTVGCAEFIFNNNLCTLFVWDDGTTITDQFNPLCPWGVGLFWGGSGFSIGPGPCAVV